MKKRMLPLVVLVSCLTVPGQDIGITSLASNGRLTWTNSFTNGLFSIEWTSSLGTNWHDNWNPLQGFWISNPASTVEVPMFYRVKCVTNLFWPWPMGSRFVYSVSNAVGNVWTQQISVLGYVRPQVGAGKEYAVMEVVDQGGMGLSLGRSTDSAIFTLGQSGLAEVLESQRAPVGTRWTNFNYHGYTRTVAVEAIETVSVKAGTFDSCYKFHKQKLEDPRLEYYEWVKPGFGLVKMVDYWATEMHPPIVYELQSWSLSSQ